jgi:hypothetical protein
MGERGGCVASRCCTCATVAGSLGGSAVAAGGPGCEAAAEGIRLGAAAGVGGGGVLGILAGGDREMVVQVALEYLRLPDGSLSFHSNTTALSTTESLGPPRLCSALA